MAGARAWRRRIGCLAAGALALAAGLLAGYGLWSVAAVYRELGNGRRTEATITGFEAARVGSRGSRREIYYPRLDFADADGRPVTTLSHAAILPEDYRQGGRLAIVHSPADPARAMPAAALAAWPDLAAWATGGFSLFCVAAGAGLLRLGLSQRTG